MISEQYTSERLNPGLTSAEASARLTRFGPNAIADNTLPSWQIFLGKFWSPIPWLLEAAIILQIALGAYLEAAVVGGLLLFNTILGFIQEGRASATLAALKQRLAPTALVLRDGSWIRMPASDLVPGDTIRLPLGAIVPADGKILSGSVLIDQSMLTGESVPEEASTGSTVYAGALVRRGQALAEVTATGANTYFGRAAELVRLAHGASTEQTAIFGVTRNLAVVNTIIGAIVIVYAYILSLPGGDLVRLALTALLATIPVALPATFTLSAALAAQNLARRGVLLTRLSAAHEAAAMDVLCSDKTGTLTRNALDVVAVRAMPGHERDSVLAYAALASSEADQDPLDAAIRRAAANCQRPDAHMVRFVPFDPETKTAEAWITDSHGDEKHICKGAFGIIEQMAETPAEARQLANELAGQGHRVIAVAVGGADSLRLMGLIALSDPSRDDAAGLINDLRQLGVRTVMVTGDSQVTAMAIARKVGIEGDACPAGQLEGGGNVTKFDVFARVNPEGKFRLVKALQDHDHVVGMCGDGTNDAPALRQAQIGIAVSTATDVAKSAAGMVMTEPGLGGIVLAVREGRVGFQRLLTYTLNMLSKKIEIVLFLVIGLAMTGHAVMTPALMVLMLMTNDFLAMSLTTDRSSIGSAPSVWHMRHIMATAIILGLCKLGFSTAVLAFGKFRLGLNQGELQALAFVTLIFGSQGLLYVVRERHHLWSSRPANLVLLATVVDITITSTLALAGILMSALHWQVVAGTFGAMVFFALILDQIKRPILRMFKLG